MGVNRYERSVRYGEINALSQVYDHPWATWQTSCRARAAAKCQRVLRTYFHRNPGKPQ